MKTSILALIVLSGWGASAQQYRPDDCSVEALTNGCKDLARPPEGLINPWNIRLEEDASGQASYDPNGQYGRYGTMDAAEMAKRQEEQVDLQAKLIDLFPGTSKFKLALTGGSNLTTAMSMAGGDVEKLPTIKSMKLYLPWPPDQKGAKSKEVDYETFKKLIDALPPEQGQQLKQISKDHLKKMSQPAANLLMGQSDPGSTVKKNLPKEKVLNEQSIKRSQVRIMRARVNDRFEKMTERAKAILIEELKARPLDGTAEQTERMIRKIQGIKFSPINPDHPLCVQGQLQAFYEGLQNTINLCPAYAGESDLAVMTAIGHEIGHSIDPCGCRVSIHKANGYANYAKLKEDLKDFSPSEEQLSQIESNLRVGEYVHLISLNQTYGKRVIDRLEETGHISAIYKPVEGTYPLETTYQCLSQKHGFADRSVAHKTLTAAREKRMHGGERTPMKNKDFSDCSQKNEMGEAMGDVFGARVAARYAAETGKTSRKDLRDLLRAYSYGFCYRTQPSLDDSHPFDKERIEKIYTADPLMQQVFGCKSPPSSHAYCLNKFGNLKLPVRDPSEKTERIRAVK